MTLKDLKKKIRKEFEEVADKFPSFGGHIGLAGRECLTVFLEEKIEEACKEAMAATDGICIMFKDSESIGTTEAYEVLSRYVRRYNEEYQAKKDKFLNN